MAKRGRKVAYLVSPEYAMQIKYAAKLIIQRDDLNSSSTEVPLGSCEPHHLWHSRCRKAIEWMEQNCLAHFS